jgi:Calcineurin-like phosphoesterase
MKKRSSLFLLLVILLGFSLFSVISSFFFTESSGSVLINVYGNGDEGEYGDEGEDGDEGEGYGRRGGDDDNQGGDYDDKGDNEGDDRIRKFFNFKQLERDDERKKESKKESVEPKPKTYDYNFADEGDKKGKNFNFAAVGDFGCSKNTTKTIKNMEDKKPELVLPLGDLSVDKPATCWLDLISPFDDKLKITLGYHEVKDGVSKLNQYKEAFGLDNLYYSFDYRRVHFIVMSTLSPFNVTSDQYKFIEQDLNKTSKNEDIDWIVVTSYGPFYTSPSAHPAKNDIRNIYHPLFDRYGVDLVLNGHNHNYQRTYPVTFNSDKKSNPIVTNGFPTGYNGNNDGIVYAIVGTGGEGFHPLVGRHPFVATQFADKFGFLNIEIDNGNPHTTLIGTFLDNTRSEVRDYFTIKKQVQTKDANILPNSNVTNILPNSNINELNY